MPKVYIPNIGAGHDFSEAEKYGEFVYVTRGRINRSNTGVMVREWSKALKDSNPDDYILITSLASLCSIGTALFGAKHKCLNLLIYYDNHKTTRYEKRTMVFHDEVT